MHGHHPTVITTSDHDRLQGMMCTMIGARTPFASLLRHKLGSAVVMLPTDIGPDVVTAGRRVRFKLDGDRSEEQVVTWEPQVRGEDESLSLWVPRGLALLGLSIGQSISYTTSTQQTELVEIECVFSDDDAWLPPGPLGESADSGDAEPAVSEHQAADSTLHT